MKAPKETLPSLLVSIARLQDDKLAQIEAWLQLPPLQQLRQLTVEHLLMLEIQALCVMRCCSAGWGRKTCLYHSRLIS